ncbi:MAG: toprim domain-containing protein [Trueperaceae bacterium]|nr:toprim domain-containing protein [Trueperaceae bacterium]
MQHDSILHELEAAGHHVVGDRLRCPSPDHEDRTPSAYAYADDRGGHVHCYGCGRHWDLVAVLVELRGMTMPEALKHVGRERDPNAPRRRPTKRPSPPVKGCDTPPLAPDVVDAHSRRAERLTAVPEALHGRGFGLDDCLALGVASSNGDATFPIAGPDGSILRLKTRRAQPGPRGRYYYCDPHPMGAGNPAWCSPSLIVRTTVLVIEGELNGAACWRARPALGIIGVAGTSGCLPLDALSGKDVVVYADGDTVGNRARQRWATAAHDAGAASVMTLDPWPDGDACDVAGAHGLTELARRLS